TRAAIGIAAATMAPTTQLYTEATSATIVATIPSASATATWDRPARTARPPGMLAMAVEQLRDHVLAAIHEGAQHVDTRALEVAQEHGDLLPRGPAVADHDERVAGDLGDRQHRAVGTSRGRVDDHEIVTRARGVEELLERLRREGADARAHARGRGDEEVGQGSGVDALRGPLGAGEHLAQAGRRVGQAE